MNEKEKIEFYIAMCNCCVMSEAMKDCPLCNFNIGLAQKAQPVASTPVPVAIPVQIGVFAMAE